MVFYIILLGLKHNLGLMILMPSSEHKFTFQKSDDLGQMYACFLIASAYFESNIILKLHSVNNVFTITGQTVIRSYENAQQTTCLCKHK